MPDQDTDKDNIAVKRGFFGRRKGPKLHAGQQRLVDELLPELVIDLDQNYPTSPHELFGAANLKNIHLEIGFGGAEHLLHRAATEPSTGYIGVEPFLNGMAKCLAGIDRSKLNNIRLYDDDAGFLLDWLPAQSLDRIYLLYPDPWPKKRHWKRRFFNQTNLERMARVLKPGCELRFATDIDTYQNWALQHVAETESFEWTARQSSDWHEPWDGWIRTRYEAKAIRENRRPGYFIFRRK